jgi:hypothetical protein
VRSSAEARKRGVVRRIVRGLYSRDQSQYDFRCARYASLTAWCESCHVSHACHASLE